MDKWKESSTSRTFSNKAHKALIENILWTISWSNYFRRVFFFNFQHDFSETQLKEWHVIWLQNTCQLTLCRTLCFPKAVPKGYEGTSESNTSCAIIMVSTSISLSAWSKPNLWTQQSFVMVLAMMQYDFELVYF